MCPTYPRLASPDSQARVVLPDGSRGWAAEMFDGSGGGVWDLRHAWSEVAQTPL